MGRGRDVAADTTVQFDQLLAFVASQAAIEPRFKAIGHMLVAGSPRGVLQAVQDEPWLLTDHAEAAWTLTALFAETAALPAAQQLIADRTAWTRQCRLIDLQPERLRLPGDWTR